MAFTYDLATSVGKVRLLVPDRNAADYVWEDAEITAFLAAEGNVVKLGTALALETMASNEAYVQKVIRILELSTNGAQTADALLKRAAVLRAQAEDEVADAGFEIAEMVLDDFSYREFLEKDALRYG